MSKHIGQTSKHSKLAPLAFLLFVCLETALLSTLIGRVKNLTLLDPKGFIATEQLNLLLFTVAVILVIALPTILLLYFFAWKYRESNTKATFNPDIKHGKFFNFTIWTLPALFMLILALTLWPAAHRLDPRAAIASSKQPLTIQVIAMRWKWVFIYPEQHVATVNYVQIPTDTPIKFELSADEAPMSSFWIPNLGGMLYAMTGHVNTLNLMAKNAGNYPGSVAEINGAGFADMKFTVHADSQAKFDDWLKQVRTSPNILDQAEYDRLLKPSEANPVAVYALAQTDLWDGMLAKYTGGHGMENMDMSQAAHQ